MEAAALREHHLNPRLQSDVFIGSGRKNTGYSLSCADPLSFKSAAARERQPELADARRNAESESTDFLIWSAD